MLTFAGGEELYVFVNKQLLVQLFHDPSNSTTPCTLVELHNAQAEGIFFTKYNLVCIEVHHVWWLGHLNLCYLFVLKY